MYSKPPQYPENPFWAHKAACPATVFFFPRLAGKDSLAYSVLVLLLFGCLFQPVKTLIADDVFNPAGVGLRSLGVNACGDKLLGKEAVSLEDFFRQPRGLHRSDGESDLRPL